MKAGSASFDYPAGLTLARRRRRRCNEELERRTRLGLEDRQEKLLGFPRRLGE